MRPPVLRWTLLLCGAGGALFVLCKSPAFAEVRDASRLLHDIDPAFLLLALAFTLFSQGISGAIWARLLLRLGHRVSPRVGHSAFLTAGLGGYVVNGAGPAVGCAMILKRHGICPTRAVLLSVMGNALGFSGVLVWAPLGLLLLSRTGMDRALPLLGHYGPLAALLALLALAVAMIVVLHALAAAPRAGNAIARRLLGARWAEQLAASTAPSVHLRAGTLMSLVPWAAAAWLANTLSLYVLVHSLDPGAHAHLGDVVGSAALASTLGSLAFFVPDGVGVRDGALVALLSHSTGLPIATCAAAALLIRAFDPVCKLSLLLILASGIDRARIWHNLRDRLGLQSRRAAEAGAHAVDQVLPHVPALTRHRPSAVEAE